ncbi:uncharacterized protein G2W53_000952 [Senna tora]|uniref:Uncharacterized protein n=1 Tax=Senna tora TaxID=362788 RepID=A0A834XF97_9FABA|nr:uncharacterized protein G2W53_000952 [Senna tora]
MASSTQIERKSSDSDDTTYSYNESPTHEFIKDEPNDVDSDATLYSSDKEAAPKKFMVNLEFFEKELYNIHHEIADTRVLAKMMDHHVKPKPKPYVLILDHPATA